MIAIARKASPSSVCTHLSLMMRRAENLRRQADSLGIRYPVVSDNDFQTWNAYNVEAWPTVFLLDKQGRIRWMRVGEGDYEEAERLIQKLLAEQETQSEEKSKSISAVIFGHILATWDLTSIIASADLAKPA